MRLGRSRAAAAEVVGTDDERLSAPYELAAVELLTVDGTWFGWIATDGARTSDWLNARDVASVHGLQPRDGGEPVASHPASALPPTAIDREQILWVVPPPLPANRHLRLHRRRVRVNLELEGYEVIGQVHVRPGADANDAILRATRVMVPLTDVVVRSIADPADAVARPVLIVNAAHVQRLVMDGPGPASEHATTDDELRGSEVAPTVSTPAGDVPDPEAPVPVESPGHALVVLLEAGIIDVIEFQAMRARIIEAAAAP